MRREKFINQNKIRIITLGGKQERGLWGESGLINKSVHYDFSGKTGKEKLLAILMRTLREVNRIWEH